MPLEDPQFDSRAYRDILNEALARIPVHNPNWTNFTDADPGVTLLQLFAYLTESIIYRANLIPERNRKKFLRLLGQQMQAATAATGIVSFANPNGPIEPVTVTEELELLAGDIPFRTQNGLSIHPIEAKVFYKALLSGDEAEAAQAAYGQLYASFEQESDGLSFYETRLLEAPVNTTLPTLRLADTVDGAAWLALLARSAEEVDAARDALANQPLTLGILPALDAAGCVLYPVGPAATEGRSTLRFETPVIDGNGGPRYRPLPVRTEDKLLAEPAILELSLPDAAGLDYWSDLDPLESGTGNYPPSLEDSQDAERLISWIRVRTPQASSTSDTLDSSLQVNVVLSWIGINAARVRQRAQVKAELLPSGTGEPDQSARLANTPVIAETLKVTVGGAQWRQIDDLSAAEAEVPQRSPRLSEGLGQDAGPADPAEEKVRVYTIDVESGEVRFGDGVRGARPPRGAVIQASYDYGGGIEGNVGLDRITKGNLPTGIKVRNPIPTWGADSAETIDQAEARIPAFLTHRDRLVTEADFKEITMTTPGVEIGRADILPLFHPKQAGRIAEGVVSVLVVPKTDPLYPEYPRPDALFLETVCAHLQPRRILTTELHVLGPIYVPLYVSIAVEIIPGRASGPVLVAVQEQIERFLSPLEGGFEEKGWPLGKTVEAAEVMAAAIRVDGIASVPEFYLADGDGVTKDSIPLSGVELPELVGVSVTQDAALTIGEVVGTTETGVGADSSGTFTPVPVIPQEC
jgi:hypothetical protein